MSARHELLPRIPDWLLEHEKTTFNEGEKPLPPIILPTSYDKTTSQVRTEMDEARDAKLDKDAWRAIPPDLKVAQKVILQKRKKQIKG